MRARRWLALICLVGVFSALIWYFLIRTDPLAEEVDRLLAAMPRRGRQATIDDLLALGPSVIPHLARNARQHDTILTKAHRFVWRKLPQRVQVLFKRPRDRGMTRAAAMDAIAGLGPLAAYGAARAVIEGVTDPVQAVRWHAQYAIEWLVPEKPEALKIYAQVLADMNQPFLMRDLTVSEAIWPKAPSLVPLLKARLVQPEHAHLAAIALGYCGSNAIAAIPLLIQTTENGFAAASSESDSRLISASLDHNRAMAVQALGSIGLATPEVIAALTRAWNGSNASVQAKAAEAIATLASNMTSVPDDLVAGLDDHNNGALSAKLHAIAKIGPPARGALDSLQKFSDTNYLRGWLTEPDQNVMYWRLQDITVAANVAICCIDPEQCRALLPGIATQIVKSWGVYTYDFLKELHAYSNEVISALEPVLRERNETWRSSWAAYIILAHNPSHSEAIAVLQRNKTQGSANERMLAAERLFDATGDTNGVWQLIEEGLSPGSKLGQWSVSFVGKMGPAAVPILRRSLWHKDHFVRIRAGLALRKLAPEELEFKRDQSR